MYGYVPVSGRNLFFIGFITTGLKLKKKNVSFIKYGFQNRLFVIKLVLLFETGFIKIKPVLIFENCLQKSKNWLKFITTDFKKFNDK